MSLETCAAENAPTWLSVSWLMAVVVSPEICVVAALVTSTASSESTDSALSCVVVRACACVVLSAPIWVLENSPSAVVVRPWS